MRKFLIASIFLAATATAASAQSDATSTSNPTKFEGFRLEGNIGYDRFQANGGHNNKLGYGATVGWDGSIGDKLLIGPEASYWTARNGNEVCEPGVINGTVCTKSFEEWGAGVRVGYKVTPNVVVFGKGGYVSNEQRKSFVAGPGQTSFYDHYHTDGYQYGGGVELSMANRFSGVLSGLYVNAQYLRARYDDHTSRQRAMAGIGIHFQ